MECRVIWNSCQSSERDQMARQDYYQPGLGTQPASIVLLQWGSTSLSIWKGWVTAGQDLQEELAETGAYNRGPCHTNGNAYEAALTKWPRRWISRMAGGWVWARQRHQEILRWKENKRNIHNLYMDGEWKKNGRIQIQQFSLLFPTH